MGSTRFHFDLCGGPESFILIYMGVHEVLFLFIWGSTRFPFDLYGGPRALILIYWVGSRWGILIHIGVRDVSF